MSSVLALLVFAIIAVVSVGQKKAQEEARRQRGNNLPPSVPRRRNVMTTNPLPRSGGPTAPADYRKSAAPRTGPDAGRVVQNVDRRVRTREQSGPGRAFERSAGSRDRDFTETSSAADVKYTTQGCGCDARGNSAAGRSHGVSNAIYDEARFFEEAQEMRKGRWT